MKRDESCAVLGKGPFREFDDFCSKFGVIFQSDRLLPWRTALENAKIGLEILGYPEQRLLLFRLRIGCISGTMVRLLYT